MRILVAVDQSPYSAHAVREVARLAANTWADVSLLGVKPKNRSKGEGRITKGRIWEIEGPLPNSLSAYMQDFFSYFNESDCPYTKHEFSYKVFEVKKGVWEESNESKSAKKSFKARIRFGNPVKEILAEAKEEESDLIVLGCNNARGCAWENGANVPQKVANDALCSVLVAKEQKKVQKIVCCLDHDKVSQPSLEMINQLVTLHNAKLVIAGLTDGEVIKSEVEQKMDNILRYYLARNIEPLIELVQLSSLGAFIEREARSGLMALWMGKKSILEKAFPKDKVSKLIKVSASSVLILR